MLGTRNVDLGGKRPVITEAELHWSPTALLTSWSHRDLGAPPDNLWEGLVHKGQGRVDGRELLSEGSIWVNP